MNWGNNSMNKSAGRAHVCVFKLLIGLTPPKMEEDLYVNTHYQYKEVTVAMCFCLLMAHWAQGNFFSSFFFIPQVYLDVLLPHTDIAQGQEEKKKKAVRLLKN